MQCHAHSNSNILLGSAGHSNSFQKINITLTAFLSVVFPVVGEPVQWHAVYFRHWAWMDVRQWYRMSHIVVSVIRAVVQRLVGHTRLVARLEARTDWLAVPHECILDGRRGVERITEWPVVGPLVFVTWSNVPFDVVRYNYEPNVTT